MLTPEQKARENIDKQLEQSGWIVQDYKAINPSAGPGIAVRENARLKNIYIDFINCEPEHVHVSISLGSDQTISKVAQLIKGESSNWINKNKLITGHFEWQDEYIAVSVSESQINKVRDYIKNQKEHHRKKSFAEEYEEFTKKYGFTKYTK